MSRVKASDIARAVGRELVGADQYVRRPADLSDFGAGDLIWLKKYTPENAALINDRKPALVICDKTTAPNISVPHITSDNPRLDFIKVLNQYYLQPEEYGVHPTAIVHPDAVIGARVAIGPFARIGPGVKIGDDCVISGGVSLEGKTTLGRACRIKANSVVGAAGFGFERLDDGTPVHFPHIGGVELGDEVWLGACTTVERAGLGMTRLCDHVKVDDLVQIGHNTVTGENTLIMANVVLCGGVAIGRDCWIAPNTVIKQKVKIGNNVTVGLGSVVIRDLADGTVAAGVPAKPLPQK